MKNRIIWIPTLFFRLKVKRGPVNMSDRTEKLECAHCQKSLVKRSKGINRDNIVVDHGGRTWCWQHCRSGDRLRKCIVCEMEYPEDKGGCLSKDGKLSGAEYTEDWVCVPCYDKDRKKYDRYTKEPKRKHADYNCAPRTIGIQFEECHPRWNHRSLSGDICIIKDKVSEDFDPV